ncbi:MAG TPA: YicC/YloC family endoribonuclease [Thermoanaerobaculia bacterium]|nr:YicC/YloC family endoribonuclease [Thermoanaerobaculia bacterium]
MKSMTGFGKAAGALADGTEVSVVVKGVNHRFLDLSIKLRDEYASAEPAIRRAVAKVVQRGHVDVLIRTARPSGAGGAGASAPRPGEILDLDAAERYARFWKEDSLKRGLAADLTARDLLSLPGVVRQSDPEGPGEGTFEESLVSLVDQALADFDASRVREGAALSRTFEEILQELERGVASLDAARAGISERIATALRERIEKLAAGVPLDEARLAQEVALLADRADITEEVDRLRAHLSEVRRLVAGAGPVGRRLDHLAQELHREVNTSGSKVREAAATRLVLDLKSELEAFKEQVQNVE